MQGVSPIVRRPSSIVHRPSDLTLAPVGGYNKRMEKGEARLEAVVRGRVQGVGFRAFVRERARRLGLGGFVRNEWDGTVLVVAEGPRDRLEALLEALRQGPAGAWVSSVETRWDAPSAAPPA